MSTPTRVSRVDIQPDRRDRVFNTLKEGNDSFLDLDQKAFSPRDSVRYYTVSPGLLSKYQNEFRVTLPEKYLTDGNPSQAPVFDSAVCGYFNRDLARAMALADWGISHLEDWYEVQYLLEDAVIRTCSCWDYLFQHLSYFIDLDQGPLASRWGRDELLGMRAYDYDWIRGANNVHTLLSVPKPVHEALNSVNAVKNYYSFRYLTTQDGSKKFFRHLRDSYAESEWINGIRRLFRDQSTKKLLKLRNDIVHVYSLSNTMALKDSEQLGPPVTGVAFNYEDPHDVWNLLISTHKALAKAIPLLRRALIIQDIPSPKENETHLFHVHELVCGSCHTVTPIPCPIDLCGMVFCRNCTTWTPEDEVEINDAVPVSHVAFASLVHNHFERMIEHIDKAPALN